MSMEFDGKPKSNVAAAKAEALAEGVKFDFDGEHYELPTASDWDIDVFEYAANGDILNAVKALLGPEQWEKFRTEDDGEGGRTKKRRTLRDLTALWEQTESATGVQPGE